MTGKRSKVVLLPPLEAMIAIAQCPPNGYVHARSRREIRGRDESFKRIWYQHYECYHHFVCRALRLFGPPTSSQLLEAHREGTTDRNAVADAVANMFRQGRLQVIAVQGFDGGLVGQCYYCNTIPRKLSAVATYGKKPRVNGPTVA